MLKENETLVPLPEKNRRYLIRRSRNQQGKKYYTAEKHENNFVKALTLLKGGTL